MTPLDPALAETVVAVAHRLVNGGRVARPGTYRGRLWDIDLDLIITKRGEDDPQCGRFHHFELHHFELRAPDWFIWFTGHATQYADVQVTRVSPVVIFGERPSFTFLGEADKVLTDLTMIKLSGDLHDG